MHDGRRSPCVHRCALLLWGWSMVPVRPKLKWAKANGALALLALACVYGASGGSPVIAQTVPRVQFGVPETSTSALPSLPGMQSPQVGLAPADDSRLMPI